MANGGVHITGLKETIRAFEKAGVDVEELKDVNAEIASVAADTIQTHLPRKSGALRASARGNRTKAGAAVTIGKARVPYAGPIVYGWRARNIRPSDAIPKTDREMEARIPDLLTAGWEKIAQRNGLM